MHGSEISHIDSTAREAEDARKRAQSIREIASHGIAQRTLHLQEQLNADELSLKRLTIAEQQSHRNLYGMLRTLWTSDSPAITSIPPGGNGSAEKIIRANGFPTLHLTEGDAWRKDIIGMPVFCLATSDSYWMLGINRTSLIGPEKPASLPSPDLQSMYEDDCDTVTRLFDALSMEVPEQFRTEPLLDNPLPAK